MRAERAKLKSRRDDRILAQGKRSAALGYEPKMISFLFSFRGLARRRRARPLKEKRKAGGTVFTQECGLGGLALGYFLAAPPGRPNDRQGVTHN